LTLQSCLNNILEAQGGNDYKLSHMGKEALLRNDRLPDRIGVTEAGMEVYRTFMGAEDAANFNANLV
jgi:hypothetical protein